MDRIRIVGGQRLNGTIPISGAKNAALPLMIASLLTRETLTLNNVPRLADVHLLARILGNHGVDVTIAGKKSGQRTSDGQTFRLTAPEIVDTTAPYEMVARMRASFWVLAPLVARCGRAKVSLPGGCAIGTRPVDLHLTTLEALGAEIELEGGYVIARAPRGLTGNRVELSKVSVGATHNALMAAVLARGETLIENAAREPEVVDLGNCLIRMGARIEGLGTPTLWIQGRETLHSAEHTVLPDRIETGTYAMAAAMTGGDVLLDGARADLLQEALQTLRSTGIEVEERPTGIRIARNGGGLQPVTVETQPFPGFPTDLQAQLIALMCMASGTSHGARDHLREPLHARSGIGSAWCPYRAQGRHCPRHRRQRIVRRSSHGDRSTRLGVARNCRACGTRRDDDRPCLSSRSRLRAHRGQAAAMWGPYRAAVELSHQTGHVADIDPIPSMSALGGYSGHP